MIGEFNVHNVVSVHLDSIGRLESSYGTGYHRRIVLESRDQFGNRQDFQLNVFSDNGHNLLVSDAELDAILLEPVKEAA